MAENANVIHLTKSRSWWTGRITALCGATEQAGRYETDTWRLIPLRGQRCPACQQIKNGGA